MLVELNIRNFALIEELRVQFGSGFNVLTGETGAGKSIVIDAINAILGERMGADVIRSGEKRASVEGAFDLTDSPDRLQELRNSGVLEEDEVLVAVLRDFAASGKTQCRVSGRMAPVSLLREVGQNLVDVHGQHEHQSLLDPARHLEILDHWCSTTSLRNECAELDRQRRTLLRELEELRRGEREKAQRLDLLQFQANEIDAARLQEGEEEELQNERRRLANMERLMAQVSQARALLAGDGEDGQGSLDALAVAVRLLSDASKDDEALGKLVEALESALYAVQEAAHEVAAYHESLETNPARLEEVEERLSLLRSLSRKYGDTIREMLAYRARIEEEINRIEGAGEREARLNEELVAMAARQAEVAATLSHKRKAGAGELETQIAAELAHLALTGARFQVSMETVEPGPTGGDRMEFLFSANPGEPARPLARIASGGEMSRIMLAIKSLLASSVGVPTVIFDEIDTGVGGRTGEAIGEKLYALGSSAQVICVTHLPQIAAMADHHFHVRKEVRDGRTTVHVQELKDRDRVEELSRMLGGGKQTAARHAQDMLRRRKAELRAQPLPLGV